MALQRCCIFYKLKIDKAFYQQKDYDSLKNQMMDSIF